MNIKSLAKKIQYFDNCYRRGEAKVSDVAFDSLYNELRKRNPNHPIFGQSMKLLSLDNYCFSEWWSENARNEAMGHEYETHLLSYARFDSKDLAKSFDQVPT